MGLYQKHRPKTFTDIIGNESTVLSLQSIVERKKEDRPQVYLFSGSTGCGKTTIARILATEMGCSCTESDFNEINSANNRGIDTAREITRAIRYKPLSGQIKIYLFDEAHQATKDFQNALLKIFEDTPKHIIFILCTTNPEKIIPTVKNRCTHYTVDRLKQRQIIKLLQDVTRKERKRIPIENINKLAELSAGIPREALTMLDKIIDLEQADIENEIKQFNKAARTTLELCQALLQGKKWNIIIKILNDVLEQQEPEQIRQAILTYMFKVLLNEHPNAVAAEIIEYFKNDFFSSGKAGIVQACFLLTQI